MGKVNVAHKGVGEGKPPIPTEIIAESILEISNGMKRFRSGRLNEKALVLLLHHASGVSQTDVRAVLMSLEDLEGIYLNKKQ